MSYIEPHKRGDSWGGMQLKLSELQADSVTEIPRNLTGCTVLIQFRKYHDSAIVMEFSTADSTITIPNPLNGIIIVKGRKIEILGGDTLIYDVQLTDANGIVETLFADSWIIDNDISR